MGGNNEGDFFTEWVSLGQIKLSVQLYRTHKHRWHACRSLCVPAGYTSIQQPSSCRATLSYWQRHAWTIQYQNALVFGECRKRPLSPSTRWACTKTSCVVSTHMVGSMGLRQLQGGHIEFVSLSQQRSGFDTSYWEPLAPEGLLPVLLSGKQPAWALRGRNMATLLADKFSLQQGHCSSRQHHQQCMPLRQHTQCIGGSSERTDQCCSCSPTAQIES